MKVIDRSDLERLREKGRAHMAQSVVIIRVGMATCGLSAGAGEVYAALKEEAAGRQLDARLVPTGCLGYCRAEPLVDIRIPRMGRVLYANVSPGDAAGMVRSLETGLWPEEKALARISEGDEAPTCGSLPDLPLLNELPFYARQEKIVLKNCGWIDPLSLEEYIACGGYFALFRALREDTPDGVIEKVTAAGLRGRGGGGFPTGRKWRTCRDAGIPRCTICNADEGDPGAYMDRTVLESDPFSVVEGLTITGYAVGAERGFIYVRDEYPLAVQRVAHAIERASEAGLLGRHIFETGFDFSIEIVRGAGAFVCGEETALIASIEGEAPEPRPKPPYPAVSGLWGMPTVVNNVKTLAIVPRIITNGPKWFASKGTRGNAGTVVFSLVGQAANTGLVEVPLGLTLSDLLQDIGGGALHADTPIKAVQTGGPSGGCLPVRLFDLPIEYETLAQSGSIMGSGGMVVLDENTCMVDVARYFLNFTRAESCGKCTPCREGTRAMYDILTRIAEGRGSMKDLESLQELGTWVKDASLCGLGQTAPNPVLSTLRYFSDEYIAHVRDRACPAGVCRRLITLHILPDRCSGCGLCMRECPAGAVSGEKKKPHRIDTEKCTRCRVCMDVCPEGAVQIQRGRG